MALAEPVRKPVREGEANGHLVAAALWQTRQDQRAIPEDNPDELPGSVDLTLSQVQRMSSRGLFHRLWTKAVGTVRYDKTEWMELQGRLERAGLI